MATYTEKKRPSDAYRSDSRPHGLNFRDKGTPPKKVPTNKLSEKDKQK